MSLVAELDAAIAAHSLWKSTLRASIASGAIAKSTDTIACDDRCRLGQWLLGLSLADRAAPQFAEVDALHSAFHAAASQVARSVVAGNRRDAEELMKLGGPFSSASAALTRALMAWRKAEASVAAA
jgi:hypothetical protein